MKQKKSLLRKEQYIKTNHTSSQALHRTLAELKNIKYAIDQSAIVAITDKHGVIEYVNDKFLEISKYEKHELIGKTHSVINSGYHPKEFFIDLWRKISSGNVWHGEICNRAKDGEYYWVDTTITPLLDEDGKPERYISIRFEITERKLLEQQKDEFISIASHELKTPITSIKAFAQILERKLTGVNNEQIRHIINRINKQTDHLAELVGDLLDVTKIQAGKLVLQKERIHLNEVVHEAVDDLQTTTHGNAHAISIREHEDLTVIADRYRITQVLINLLTNAVKYSPESDSIIVDLSRNNGEALVHVQDFGIGIPEDKIDRIFERFFRIEHKTGKQEKFTSLGLGLHIAAQIVKHHGGISWK